MSENQPPTAGADMRNRATAWIAVCLLVGQFLYRMLVAAHEYPRPTERFMTMAFDAVCLVGVVLLRSRLPQPFYWIGFIAGVGLFLIRMNSQDSWATGHLNYYLLPR